MDPSQRSSYLFILLYVRMANPKRADSEPYIILITSCISHADRIIPATFVFTWLNYLGQCDLSCDRQRSLTRAKKKKRKIKHKLTHTKTKIKIKNKNKSKYGHTHTQIGLRKN